MAGRSTCCTRTSPRSTRRWSRGALALAVLNAATLVSAGHPWNISFGYTLWGGKLAAAAGVDLSASAFWTWPFPSRALAGSVFADVTPTMNFGIIAGAFQIGRASGRERACQFV